MNATRLRRGAGFGSDDFPYRFHLNDAGDTTYIDNLKLLAFQSNYHLGYNIVLRRDNRNDLDFEVGGGVLVVRSFAKEFIKDNWNVNTDGFGIFANVQCRYRIFATGLNINIPVVNKLPASISVYSSIGINFKKGGVLSKIFKGKKNSSNIDY